jgi:murein DD-endopeptidase MepM/ murein hydrolase activator NlpD
MIYLKKFLFLLLIFVAVCPAAVSGQISDDVILKYSLNELEATANTQAFESDKEGREPTEISTSDILKKLLNKVGNKERKIINKVLEVSQQQKLFDVEKLDQKLEKKLGEINIPALMNLYNNLKALKIKKFDLSRLDEIKGALVNIDKALRQYKDSPEKYGELSFFAGMTRDQLANVAPTYAEKHALKASALNNYNDTITSLASDEDRASKEKVEDAKERVATLQTPFGNIIPIAPKKGTRKIFITSDYGMRIHPVKKTKRFHAGVDLAGWKCKGWKVLAIGSGRVVKSGWESGYGYVVIVSHEIEGEQYYTRYAHLKKKDRLKVGTVVKHGDLIGFCNNSGISTGSHLHFEIRKESYSGKTLDPKVYLPEIEILN